MGSPSASEHLNLGDLARYAVTGFEGIVTAKVSYLSGCDQVCLQPQGLTEAGKTKDGLYFDAPYVDLVTAGVVDDRTPDRVTGASMPPGISGEAPPPS